MPYCRFNVGTHRPAWVVVALLLACCGATLAAESPEFHGAKKLIQQQLRSKQPGDRIEALKQLARYKEVESAKLVIQLGFHGDGQDVSKAAYETLLEMKDEPAVSGFLVTSLKKETKRKAMGEAAVPLLAVLLAAESEDARTAAVEFIDHELVASKNGVLTLIELADQLGAHGEPSDMAALLRLVDTQPFKNEFAVRRTVVQALTHIEDPQAVGKLIDLMGKINGEAQADIAEYLTEITGEKLAFDAAAWAKWWAENQATWKYPPRPARAPLRSVALNGGGTYYGIPIYGQQIVFVLDTSGSMNNQRLPAAKRELIKAISNLRESVQFAIVVFNTDVKTWQKHLVYATPANKRAASSYIESQNARGTTASYDALETAFGFKAEAIYFLTDGAPHGGKISVPQDIVSAITKGNRVRRESIYTIGIAPGPPGNLFDAFLKSLADENQGIYRRIEQ